MTDAEGPPSSSEGSARHRQVEQQLWVLALVLDQIQDLVTITDLEGRDSPDRPSAFLRKPFRLGALQEALALALDLGQDLPCEGDRGP